MGIKLGHVGSSQMKSIYMDKEYRGIFQVVR